MQAIVHVVLLGGTLIALPIIPSEANKPSPDGEPLSQIMTLLAMTVGLPFLALASTGPLLQGWFARVSPGVSPYRLYALSNAGSLLALLAYPFLFEPKLRLPVQAQTWSIAYGAFALLCVACAWRLFRSSGPLAMPLAETSQTAVAVEQRPAVGSVVLWLSLSACGSALLLATTNQLCQDVAVVPFLWIAPLSVYLLTFILCFDSPRWYVRPVFLGALPLAITAAAATMIWGVGKFQGWSLPLGVQIGVYLAALFVCCMGCHGELVRIKPSPRYLRIFISPFRPAGR
jgi:hypothetical protein